MVAFQKEPGTGGAGTISGKVEKEVRVVITNANTAQYTVPGANEDVYIIYGDHTSPDDKILTNYNGVFEFRNLRKGSYKVYVYSKDTTGINPPVNDPSRMVILSEVELQDNSASATLPTMTIYDIP